MPERSPTSVYRILPDRAITPEFTFDDTVPAVLRPAFVAGVREDLEESSLRVVPRDDPKALVVGISVTLVVQPGRTDAGTGFFAARATAVVSLIRNRFEVDGGHAVARTEAEARERALARLREKVYLALTW